MTATGGRAGGLGRIESGIHFDPASVSRTTSAARSTLWSMKSATSLEYLRRWTGMLESWKGGVGAQVSLVGREGGGGGLHTTSRNCWSSADMMGVGDDDRGD